MTITSRAFTSQSGYTEDFNKVLEFIIRINSNSVSNHHFLWGRWEWAFALRYQDEENLNLMRLWEDDGKIVGVAVYEDEPGNTYILVDPNYQFLKEDMLDYSITHLKKDGISRVLIDNNDRKLGIYARSKGMKPTNWFEDNAIIDINTSLEYSLPEGYRLISFDQEYSVTQHNLCLHHGFNNEGEAPETEKDLALRLAEISAPHQDKSLLIAIVAPNGDYASYCGMWYMKGQDYALVEPVATHPNYRKLGLGKAVVLEGVKRCGSLGAKVAYVGSSQQFYYNIGFNPISKGTMWEIKSTT